MRTVVQRVREASVTVETRVVGEIESGLLVLVGVTRDDSLRDADVLAQKISTMRIFSDAEGKMNLSVSETGGSVLVVSQFTLVGDVRKGRRPSFSSAADPEQAVPIIDRLVSTLRSTGLHVACGEFGAKMNVRLTNDGPVTFMIDVNDGVVT
ncbi:MAG: D-aminoacyl-tRNA deacylase [Acidimicrobiia bacterium]